MINKIIPFIFVLLTISWSTHASVPQHAIETVATLSANTPPGNIAVGPDGRIFLSIHPFYDRPVRVVELLADGTTKPYPNHTWAFTAKNQKKSGLSGLYGVLGLNVDQKGVLWMLDSSGPNHAGRLIGWDTKTETLHRLIYLARPMIQENSFLNDLAIDLKHNKIYITDTGTRSILVVDLNTGAVWRVLDNAPQTKSEDLNIVIDGKVVMVDGHAIRVGINPITIDSQYEYVYFGAMSGTSLYRIKTYDLINPELSETTLIERIERYADKPISDGITIDNTGNVYITSITDDSIGISKPDGTYQTLIQRDDLSWPDGFAVGPNNFVYTTINELHRSPVLNGGVNAAQGEFKVVRFKAVSNAQTGR